MAALVAAAAGEVRTGSRCLTCSLGCPGLSKRSWNAAGSSPVWNGAKQQQQFSSDASRQAGPSRLGAPQPDKAKEAIQPRVSAGKRRMNALLRMNSERPIIPSLTPSSAEHAADQAKGLSRLHATLLSGAVDEVWSAYSDLRDRRLSYDPHTFATDSQIFDGTVTPAECRRLLGILAHESSNTRAGMNRLLLVFSDVRAQQRRLLARIGQASGSESKSRRYVLVRELQAWDQIMTPTTLQSTLVHISKSLRSAGLEEVEQVLDQLLTYEANEQSRSQHTLQKQLQASREAPNALSGEGMRALHDRILSPLARSAISEKHEYRRSRPAFPDLATYNTLLNLITRTTRPNRRPGSETSSDEPHEDDEADSVARVTQEELGSHSAQLHASLSSKLQRFKLDAEAAPVGLDPSERADRLFHSVLERMQRTSGLEPDQTTYNIMISMYCRLDRWDAVRRVVRTMDDKHMLNIDCINTALYQWQIRGPLSARRMLGRSEGDSEAIEDALEVYGQLRQNLVHAELDSRHSSVAYGNPDPQSRGEKYKHRDPLKARIGSEPLSWPTENERTSGAGGPSLAEAKGNKAVEAVFGIPRVPRHVVPDVVTYGSMINCLTRSGRFADAFGVFKDLVSTPSRSRALPRARKGTGGRRAELTRDKMMQPTLPMFVSFFLGFSKHGRPSQVAEYDSEHPERSRWKLMPMASNEEGREGISTRMEQQLKLWRIETFQQIFDAFLKFEPDLEQILPKRSAVRAQSAGHLVSTLDGWMSLADKRKVEQARQAPAPNQLFWILTAIRRVSGDHPSWSLAMWRKVADKFSGAQEGEQAWKGFRLDNRLTRVLEHLETRASQDARGTVEPAVSSP